MALSAMPVKQVDKNKGCMANKQWFIGLSVFCAKKLTWVQ
jgi:hypothetical protein